MAPQLIQYENAFDFLKAQARLPLLARIAVAFAVRISIKQLKWDTYNSVDALPQHLRTDVGIMDKDIQCVRTTKFIHPRF